MLGKQSRCRNPDGLIGFSRFTQTSQIRTSFNPEWGGPLVTAEVLSRLLLFLYEGVSDPETLQRFLNELASTVNATGATFREQFFDERGSLQLKQASLFLTTGYSDEALDLYARHFHAKDIHVQRALERYRHSECATSDSVISEEERNNSEIYNDYQLKFDMGPIMWAKFVDRPNYVAAISFHRSGSLPPFAEKELELLTALAPHVRRALHLTQSLRETEAERFTLAQSLDQMDIAICMVRRDGSVARMTESAERLLSSNSGIRIRNGRLRVSSEAEQRALDSLIAGACATGAGVGVEMPIQSQSEAAARGTVRSWTAPYGGSLLITRPMSPRPLQVIISPFRSGPMLSENSTAALIQIGDPAATPRSRAAILRALYGLTATESRLADLLLQGLEVREAADRLHTTLETARFHLKRVMAKTSTRRQAELMRLMLSLPGQ
jgi:DNA-binding CsgD family transcriptional regulator/PAS domain-containing protein